MMKTQTGVLLRSVEDLAEAKELRGAISASLQAVPLNENGLRCAVWNFVGAERRAGVSPDVVITRLTELVADASVTSRATVMGLTRQFILWTVEAYFGHLGGDALATAVEPGEAALSL